jgi:predicted DNA-binding protein
MTIPTVFTIAVEFPQEMLERLERLSQKQHQPVDATLLKAAEQFLQTAGGDFISPKIARRVAGRAFFGDLAGTALGIGEPKFYDHSTRPVWRVPFITRDGKVFTEIEVDARTAVVKLTEEERQSLLDQLVEYYARLENKP